MSERRNSIHKKYALRRANTLARQATNASLSQNPRPASEYMKVTRSSIEREITERQLQLDLLDSINEMNEEDMLQTTFDLIDLDNDKLIDARELADAVRSVRGEVDKDLREDLELAVKRIASFDKSGDGQLDQEELNDFLLYFASTTDSSYRELLEMTLFALFSDKSEHKRSPSSHEDAIAAVKKEECYREWLRSKHMAALFNIFDEDGDGVIDFKEFVLGIYKITEDLQGASKAAMEAMLLFDKNESRSLNFNAFTQVILNLHEASPDNMTMDDMLEAMTEAILLAGEASMEMVSKNFSVDSVLRPLNELEGEDGLEKHVNGSTLGALEYAKVFRLFELWDLDKDNAINFKELLLGLRKFQEKNELSRTVDECCSVINLFDKEDNQELDFDEFLSFIEHFTEASGADLKSMLDFMIVNTVLKENTNEDRAFADLIELKHKE